MEKIVSPFLIHGKSVPDIICLLHLGHIFHFDSYNSDLNFFLIDNCV